MRSLRRVSLLVLLLAIGCAGHEPVDIHLDWHPSDEINAALPEGIRVLAASDASLPLRAWAVLARQRQPGIEARVLVAENRERLETVSSLAARSGARVVVNAGYFRNDVDPASHVGLLLVDGRLLQPPLRSVLKEDRRYFLARAALGLHPDGRAELGWVSGRDGELVVWDEPPPNAPEAPGMAPDLEGLRRWPVRHAVAGGPMLLVDGEVRVTTDDEVFFGSPVTEVVPRTAAGVTPEGDLVFLVADGRQRDSRGLGLVELARIMRDLGCSDALNLDGGGSSSLVVDGTLLNRPAGAEEERAVLSALAVFGPMSEAR